MLRFAANLTMMYQEHSFLDRFAAAAADGFDAVEYLFPYDHPAEEIAARLRAHGLTQALFNLPPGDWAAGERGIASLPGREAEFLESLERGRRYALATGCKRLHAMSGLRSPGLDPQDQRRMLVQRLRAIYAGLPVGNPLTEGTLIGPLVDEGAFGRMQAALEAAKAAGATVHFGDRVNPGGGGCSRRRQCAETLAGA